MSSESCGVSLLTALRDDSFAIISRSLSPKDICNLSLCCRSLNSLATSDKVWLPQCEQVDLVPLKDLVEWRKEVVSYKALCKFLISVKPLMGIWVQANPQLGNVVYVMPGFVSVVGCRIIPQEVGPLGIENGPLLWSPVFEIVSLEDGSFAFFLHGREEEIDYVYPGIVKAIEKTCTMLLLEVIDPSELMNNSGNGKDSSVIFVDDDGEGPNNGEDSSVQKKRFGCFGACFGRKVSRSYSGFSTSDSGFDSYHCPGVESELSTSFSNLPFKDKKKLLKIVTREVRTGVPESPSSAFFRCSREDEEVEIMHLSKRRALLIKMHKLEMERTEYTYRRRFHEFLSSGNIIGRLTLHAPTRMLSLFEAWPIMGAETFALYKLPMLVSPVAGQDYAGLWGGTFGWPSNNSIEGNPLYLVVISYHGKSRRNPRKRLVIATRILQGSGMTSFPNGSAIFRANIEEPSVEPFLIGSGDVDVDVKCAFKGEGIAEGYGFRYPGSKPGSLFELQDGMLAFIWQDSDQILTLQRLDLQDLLKKGNKVNSIPPIPNFSYLTRSHFNVFTRFNDPTLSWAFSRSSISNSDENEENDILNDHREEEGNDV